MIAKCRSELKKESIIKSVLVGMTIGLSVAFVIAFIAWFFDGFKGLWVSVGVGLGLWAVSAPLLYFFKFIPNDMTVMQRLDRSGLDERMVTMYELRGDNSYMATRQREDAQRAFDAAVKATGGALVKVKIATAIICAASVVGCVGVTMTVVTGLCDYGVIPSVNQMMSADWHFGAGVNGGRVYTVEFVVDKQGTGTIDGVEKVSKSVSAGGSSSVTARPAADQGGKMYYLDRWEDSDGNVYLPNSSVFVVRNVNKSMTYTAVFAEWEFENDGQFGYYFDPDGNPGDDNFGEGKGKGDGTPKPGAGDPGDMPDLPPAAPPQGGGPGGGSSADTDDTIIDGDTPYDEKYDYYYQLAMDMLANGTDGYPPELVAIIEAYFGILLK